MLADHYRNIQLMRFLYAVTVCSAVDKFFVQPFKKITVRFCIFSKTNLLIQSYKIIVLTYYVSFLILICCGIKSCGNKKIHRDLHVIKKQIKISKSLLQAIIELMIQQPRFT